MDQNHDYESEHISPENDLRDFEEPRADSPAQDSLNDMDYLWVRLSLEYGDASPEIAGDLVYSTDSSNDIATENVVGAISDLLAQVRELAALSQPSQDEVDELVRSRFETLTLEQLQQQWMDAPAPADPAEEVSLAQKIASEAEGENTEEESAGDKKGAEDSAEGAGEESTQQPESAEHTPESTEAAESTEPGSADSKSDEPDFDAVIDAEAEEELTRRRILARGTSHEDIIRHLKELTAARPEVIAFERGDTGIEIYLLCAMDQQGYVNLVNVAHGTMSLGRDLEEYVEWLVDSLPVTGAALEEEPTVWVQIPEDVLEVEFTADGDSAALVAVHINEVTGLLLSRMPLPVTLAPAGEWTLISGAPEHLLQIAAALGETTIIAEGNAHQQHLVVLDYPRPLLTREYVRMADFMAAPSPELEVLEMRWSTVPKQLTRIFSPEERIALGQTFSDLLYSLPGIAVGDEAAAANESSVQALAALFGVSSVDMRRLTGYARDVSAPLGLESVLQLLNLPSELASVPVDGFDISTISTARIFGESEAPEPEVDGTGIPLEPAALMGAVSTPGSVLENSYRLVANDRTVTLEEWMHAISNPEGIDFELTHLQPEPLHYEEDEEPGTQPQDLEQVSEAVQTLHRMQHEVPGEEPASHPHSLQALDNALEESLDSGVSESVLDQQLRASMIGDLLDSEAESREPSESESKSPQSASDSAEENTGHSAGEKSAPADSDTSAAVEAKPEVITPKRTLIDELRAGNYMSPEPEKSEDQSSEPEPAVEPSVRERAENAVETASQVAQRTVRTARSIAQRFFKRND